MKKLLITLIVSTLCFATIAAPSSKKHKRRNNALKTVAGVLNLVNKGVNIVAPASRPVSKTKTPTAVNVAGKLQNINTSFYPAYRDGMYVPAVIAPWNVKEKVVITETVLSGSIPHIPPAKTPWESY